MKSPALSLALAASASLVGATAHAVDLQLDPALLESIYFTPSVNSGNVHVPVTNHTAYSQAAPYALPCDVTEFDQQIQIDYVTAGPEVYPQLDISFFLYGDESQPIHSNGLNNYAAPYGGFSRTVSGLQGLQDHHTQIDGFLPVSSISQYGGFLFQPSDLPANVPVRMRMRVVAFSCSTPDPTTGGYSAACQLPDPTPWDNVFNVWIQRTCP